MASSARNLLRHLHSEQGRRFILYGSAVTSAAISWGYVGYQTFFIDSYRDTLQLYMNGIASRPSPELIARSAEVLDDMKLSSKYRAYVKFFTVFGFDPYHIGSTKTSKGTFIGLPANFEYKSPVDINRTDIRVAQSIPVSWNTDEGRLLEQGLMLSEKAQKFAIAREISMTDTHHVYTYSAIHSLSVMLYYLLAAAANDNFYGLHKPFSFRFTVYTLVGAFTYGVWAVSKDILTKFYENYADKRAMALGVDYAKGGAEFYTKIIQRNIGVRGIMGKEGESLYTQFGNDVEFIRQKHVPFSERKLNAENTVKEYYKQLEAKKNSEDTGVTATQPA